MGVGASDGDGLWGEAFRVERAGLDRLAGLAGAVATSGPLALGIALDEPAIGVVACFGGLNAALAVPRGPLRERLGWGGLAALLCTLSVALATAVQPSVAASVATVFAVVALAAALRAFGRDGGLTGFVIGAIFTITNGIPAEGLAAGERALWFAAGSALGLALMTLAYGRERGPGAGGTGAGGAGAGGAGAGGIGAGGEAAVAVPPLRAALASGLRLLRETFLHDTALRAHALRLAAVVAATTLLYRLLELEHGYWIPLTVLAVLQPDEHASRVRAVQRAAGTLVGTVAIALLVIVSGSQWLMVAGQALCAFGLFALFARGYFWLVVLLTPTALLTISAVDDQGASLALQRAGWSAAGILAGLAIGEAVWRLAPRLSPRRPWS